MDWGRVQNVRGNLTQEVGLSHSHGRQNPLTHTNRLAGRKHSWAGGRDVSAVCVWMFGWSYGQVTFQWTEEMKRITVHIRSHIQEADVWRWAWKRERIMIAFSEKNIFPMSPPFGYLCACAGCVHMLLSHIWKQFLIKWGGLAWQMCCIDWNEFFFLVEKVSLFDSTPKGMEFPIYY